MVRRTVKTVDKMDWEGNLIASSLMDCHADQMLEMQLLEQTKNIVDAVYFGKRSQSMDFECQEEPVVSNRLIYEMNAIYRDALEKERF